MSRKGEIRMGRVALESYRWDLNEGERAVEVRREMTVATSLDVSCGTKAGQRAPLKLSIGIKWVSAARCWPWRGDRPVRLSRLGA